MSHSPLRPEKSTARGEGISSAATTGMNSVGNAASDVYNRAPDLGISSTANSAYQRAPDLGVGAAISNVFYGRSNEDQMGENEVDEERVIRNTEGDTPKDQNNYSNPREESLQKGPSDQSRVGKSQKEIGTETGIPTMAGAGSTASPDQTNQKTIEKASSKGLIKKARVPEDYEALPSSTGNTAAAATSSSGKGKESPLIRSPKSSRSSKDHSRRTSSQLGQEENRKLSGLASTDGSPIEMEKRRSFSGKLRDQIKGEMKILAGTVTGKDEKVIQGLAIKHGDYSA